MTNPIPYQRVIGANKSSDDRLRSSSAPQSLPAAEIESLLRMAQRGAGPSKIRTQDEEIGPGDVQYLRGDSFIEAKPSVLTGAAGWPGPSPNIDGTLRQAEKLLADVILDGEGLAHAGEHPGTSLDEKPFGFSQDLKSRPGLTLNDLGDLDLDISIELGRTEILIEDILKLREGSVVSLDKLAGDPVDITANGRLVARGELLVIDGKFGVRLSEVL